MVKTQSIDTIIIGGGQAGLATSYYLTQQGHPHLVLEQASRPGHAWRTDRWDSFTLLTPNWSIRLPGAEYQGDDPDGFLARDALVTYFEQYVAQHRLPVQYDTRVTAAEPLEDGRGYQVLAEIGGEPTRFEASHVIIATGLFQHHKIAACSGDLHAGILQLHSGAYRHPAALPPGAVLVVGSAQSGCQITEELYQSGRKVYLCVGSAGRVPRRYRGEDIYTWLYMSGFLDRTVDQLPSPQAKFAANPHISGKDGGHTLNLHQFAQDGVILLSHLRGGTEKSVYFAPDLRESLAKTDQFEVDVCNLIDRFIERAGLDAPEEVIPQLRDGYMADEVTELDLQHAGISTIIWAMGYTFDFSMVKMPVFDRDGFPIQARGVSHYPGLYFVGMPWLHTQKSGLLVGVGEDAKWIASDIMGA
jgi:putative flavoprotein involved in K+ transport